MSDELVISKPGDLVSASKYDTEAAVTAIESASEYLPYIQLMGSSSGLCKQGKFPIGHFACFKGKEPIDLGENFDAVVLGKRPKAMEFGEDLITIFNPENPEFKRIQAAASNKQQGFVFGWEFLLYMPDFDDVACYLFGNSSHQQEAPNVLVIAKQQNETNEYVLANFESFLLPTNKKGHSWHVPRVTVSENALTKMITPERLLPIQEKFNNPIESEIETVDEPSRDM